MKFQLRLPSILVGYKACPVVMNEECSTRTIQQFEKKTEAIK